MVLIGGRRENNKLWWLLQNWWDEMQLVELDAEYFAGCRAHLHFSSQPKEEFEAMDLTMFHKMNESLVADSNNLDGADYPKGDGVSLWNAPLNARSVSGLRCWDCSLTETTAIAG